MHRKQKSVTLDGSSLTLAQSESIAKGCDIKISKSARRKVEAASHLVERLAKKSKPIYGVNTGFGYFANKKISKKELKILQTNLLKSHAAGYGNPLSVPETRLAMALRLNVLIQGKTGVRYQLCEALYNLIQAGIYPIIPEFGSVGASGDLAPLAHLALPLLGLGEVIYQGMKMSSQQALIKANLEPFELSLKEGLGLINGTQIMLAVGALAIVEAQKINRKADQIAALSFEGLLGNVDALNPLLNAARKQPGQIETARQVREELKGSSLWNPKQKHKLQDPYSLRCVPQIHGPCKEAVAYCTAVIERELNAATDNPLVFADQKLLLNGGNFHGEPLALAYDFAAMALSELANVSERRLEVLLNPNLSGLAPFLTPHGGLNSGYMAAQYLSASLVNQNKLLANPACIDSIPGNAGIEDHVSMGMTSARKLRDLVKHVSVVLSIEMLAAAQAVDLRKRKRKLGEGTFKTYSALRERVPMLEEDRIIAEDVKKAVEVFYKL